MEVLYTNTRDASETVTASRAIVNGLARDGGLYGPTVAPQLDIPLEDLAKMTYQETAYAVMS
ncbi:MAG: threonine synthase, partial [Clostridiales bacterium]|nr:threonine synthase [Clostridiales bacterium]